MEDVETFKNNIDSYKDSIINTLNLDVSILENRINEELFDTYINNILKPELKKLDIIDVLFNPIIIKLSKVKSVYDKYAKEITNLTHQEYIEKIKKTISLKKNNIIIEKYAKENEDIDYNNEIENYILTLYASKILKDELKTLEDQMWFINYIINVNAKKQNMAFKVLGITCSTLSNKTLVKINKFKKIKKIFNYYESDTIYINLVIFKHLTKIRSFSEALLYLINSCLTELQKHLQRSKEYSMTYDENIYRFIKENIIYNEDTLYYDINKNYFDHQIDLKTETNKMLNELANNPLFSDFDFISEINIENNNMIKNTKNYNMVDTYIDSILIKKPKLLKEYPLLQMEYNPNGSRKSLKELMEIKNDKVNFYNEQITTFKELLKEAPNEAYINEITNKLNIIETGLVGIIRCHNKMIYKALKLINVKDLETVCEELDKNELNTLEEAIEQEKNDFIKKLENNRKKIFKPSTFLANEQFLTKEYSQSARYESKLRDIRKEKEI